MALGYRATVASDVGDVANVTVASEVVFSAGYDTVLTARYAAEAMLIATTKCHYYNVVSASETAFNQYRIQFQQQ